MPMLSRLKSLIPDQPLPMRVLLGPFRGARIVMSPRASLRKWLGLYEHENNRWLERALRSTTRVLDVGANDGYFTIGCAAAFKRLGKKAEIISFEPDRRHATSLLQSVRRHTDHDVRIQVVQSFVGASAAEGVVALDQIEAADRRNTLIKIDVEGAELEVIRGARSWLDPSNKFIIEVHKAEYLEELIRLFRDHGIELLRIDQRPLPMLGREFRDPENWWLVSTPRPVDTVPTGRAAA